MAPAPTMATPKIRSRARSRAMLGPNAMPGAEADEDRAEQQAVGRVAAAERVRERLPGRDDHAGGRHGAGDADDQAAHQRRVTGEREAVLAASRGTISCRRSHRGARGAAAADRGQAPDDDGGHEEGQRVEVQREVDLVDARAARASSRPPDAW